MARELKNIGIINPDANVRTLAFSQGTSGLYLCSVTVSNKAMDDARFSVEVFNASASTNNAMISSNQIIPGRNSYETIRFTLDYDDSIYITSTSSSVSFLVSGVNQTE